MLKVSYVPYYSFLRMPEDEEILPPADNRQQQQLVVRNISILPTSNFLIENVIMVKHRKKRPRSEIDERKLESTNENEDNNKGAVPASSVDDDDIKKEENQSQLVSRKENELHSLRTENKNLKSEIKKLDEFHKSDNEKLRNENKRLSSQVEKFSLQTDKLSMKVERFAVENEKLYSNLSKVVSNVKKGFQKQMDAVRKETRQLQLQQLQKTSVSSAAGIGTVVGPKYELARASSSAKKSSAEVDVLQFLRKKKEPVLVHDKPITSALIFTENRSWNTEKMLVIGTQDGYLKFIRLRDLEITLTKKANDGNPVTSIVMTKNADDDADIIVACVEGGKSLSFWSSIIPPYYSRGAALMCDDEVSSLKSFKHNEKYMLASALCNGAIEIWDVQTRQKMYTLDRHDSMIRALDVFKNKNDNKLYLVSADEGGDQLNLWCLDNEGDSNSKFIKTITDLKVVYSLCAFEFENDIIIAAGSVGEIFLWKMNNLETIYHTFDFSTDEDGDDLTDLEDNIIDMSTFISKDGKVMLVSVSEDGRFRCVNITNKKRVFDSIHHEKAFSSLNLIGKGAHISNYVAIVGCKDYTAKNGELLFIDVQTEPPDWTNQHK